MRILMWHVHGSWTTAFVHGRHDVVLPVDRQRGPDGRGRARTWSWPRRVREVPIDDLAATDIDVAILQRPHERDLVQQWLGRVPGVDLPAVFVEHNTPRPGAVDSRHPLGGQSAIPLVHVTHFNAVMWDNGIAPVHVIEHGIPDPGQTWTGELPHAAVVVNEPVRRGRIVGTDLLRPLSEAAPLDVFGMGLDVLDGNAGCRPGTLRTHEDLPQERLHAELGRRRLYLHPYRWTSLGLALLEAMHLGMPVVVLAATEAPRAVPPAAGCVSSRLDDLIAAVRDLTRDPGRAAEAGAHARAAAVARYGLPRFLADWDDVLAEVVH